LQLLSKDINVFLLQQTNNRKEKFDALRAFGAEVVVCPTNVEPEDPKSYYSVSSRLVKEVPNSWKPNQYDNPSQIQ
jgi:cystathionine beta-synthase